MPIVAVNGESTEKQQERVALREAEPLWVLLELVYHDRHLCNLQTKMSVMENPFEGFWRGKVHSFINDRDDFLCLSKCCHGSAA